MRRDQIEELFYGKPEQQRRFTQDFPILPDVWIAYGKTPGQRVELLLTPHNDSDAARLARALRERLASDAGLDGAPAAPGPAGRARVLFNESVVLASLTFRELARAAMPLTDWWRRVVVPIGGVWQFESLRAFAAGLIASDRIAGGPELGGADPRLLKKLIRIVGCIELDRQGRPMSPDRLADTNPSGDEIDAFAGVFDGLQPVAPSTGAVLWSISANREASTSVWRSRLTVKADAAARLFEAETSGIRWAVLDTGIDATHKAFRRRDAAQQIVAPAPDNHEDELGSRVLRTYDFLKIKDLLDPDTETPVAGSAAARIDPDRLRELSDDLRISLLRGRSIDWDLLEPFLRVPHTVQDYQPPRFDSHGTHVAGILAANWQEAPQESPLKGPLVGVCPELELYDLRVLPDDPAIKADEFTIIAALQFVRHLNAHKNLMVVHGVNLSLSVPHDVANYACGRTPVCDECERVVSAGVIVVTAAGNRGFDKLRDPAGGAAGDYRYISITDPGNAESVITVGSTHRMMPHNYGVSYFSSRGPTGDGRTKPDLVAPGERIDSCSLNGYYETMDGTSMAAPHVSGAAALLIGRHRELIGQPQRVKEILGNSATDLGREPRFQGRGLVDVLRALQSL
ncbi:MAG: S8 family peptidase [Acidobacteriota bacterium]